MGMTNTAEIATVEAQTVEPFTDEQATDEIMLIAMRKLRRLAPDGYTALIAQLPDYAPEVIEFAEQRADKRRATDAQDGITRVYRSRYEDMDD